MLTELLGVNSLQLNSELRFRHVIPLPVSNDRNIAQETRPGGGQNTKRSARVVVVLALAADPAHCNILGRALLFPHLFHFCLSSSSPAPSCSSFFFEYQNGKPHIIHFINAVCSAPVWTASFAWQASPELGVRIVVTCQALGYKD